MLDSGSSLRFGRNDDSNVLASKVHIRVEIPPFRIVALDQVQLPFAAPFLDLLFPQDGIGHRFVELRVYQQVHAVSPSKAGGGTGLVLPYSAREITRHAD